MEGEFVSEIRKRTVLPATSAGWRTARGPVLARPWPARSPSSPQLGRPTARRAQATGSYGPDQQDRVSRGGWTTAWPGPLTRLRARDASAPDQTSGRTLSSRSR
jgi:hypothetical protein